jgi:PIN like domain
MRNLYPGYTRFSDDELAEMWKSCVFAFDASALLDLYRLTPTSREEYFWALEYVKDRIWLPNQSGLEYYENRKAVITTGEGSYQQIPKLVTESASHFRKQLDRYRQYRWIEADRWLSVLDNTVKELVDQIEKEKHVLENFLEHDPVEKRLQTLFGGKVGAPYPSMHAIFSHAEQRLQLRIPPGFKDSAEKKDFHHYGDVVIWFQLLDFAKESRRDLVFVTSDTKADWWAQQDGKTLGVRPELVQEMYVVGGVHFHMYTPNRFMEYAKQFFGPREDVHALDQTAKELLEVQEEKAAESDKHLRSEYVKQYQVLNALAEYPSLAAGLDLQKYADMFAKVEIPKVDLEKYADMFAKVEMPKTDLEKYADMFAKVEMPKTDLEKYADMFAKVEMPKTDLDTFADIFDRRDLSVRDISQGLEDALSGKDLPNISNPEKRTNYALGVDEGTKSHRSAAPTSSDADSASEDKPKPDSQET